MTTRETGPLFVAMSRFEVANGMEDDVRAASAERPGLVDTAPGFVRMDVLRPADKPAEFWLLTYWTDAESFESWHRGHTYKDSHKGIPAGLKLVSDTTEIRYLEHVTS